MQQPRLEASKTEWRTWAEGVRSMVTWEVLSPGVCDGLRSFPPMSYAKTILLYSPMARELDVRPIMEFMPTKRWLVTRTPSVGALTIHDINSTMERHRYGYEQPVEGTPQVSPTEVDLALVPGLAFDLFGNRLGRGGGYYDRLLPSLQLGAVLVGVTPSELVVDCLPEAVHDVRVQWLASEEGVIGVA